MGHKKCAPFELLLYYGVMTTQALLNDSYAPEFVELWDDPANLDRFREYISNTESADGWVNLSTVLQDFESDTGVS